MPQLRYMDIPKKDGDFSIVRKIDSQLESFQNNLHAHKHIEMSIVISGHTVHELNGVLHDSKSGYAFLIMPDNFHTYHTEADEFVELYTLRFDKRWVQTELLTELTLFKKQPECQLSDDKRRRFISVCEMISDAFYGKKEYAEVAIYALLNYLIVFLINECHDKNEGDEKGILVRNMMRCIEENLHDSYFSMYTLSQQVGRSQNYVADMLKKTTNMTFPQYINMRRLIYAEKLLRVSRIPVKQVAEASGFNSVSYFIKMFRQMYGLTPKEYCENYDKQYL